MLGELWASDLLDSPAVKGTSHLDKFLANVGLLLSGETADVVGKIKIVNLGLDSLCFIRPIRILLKLKIGLGDF